jgi:hypothetical protein
MMSINSYDERLNRSLGDPKMKIKIKNKKEKKEANLILLKVIVNVEKKGIKNEENRRRKQKGGKIDKM